MRLIFIAIGLAFGSATAWGTTSQAALTELTITSRDLTPSDGTAGGVDLFWEGALLTTDALRLPGLGDLRQQAFADEGPHTLSSSAEGVTATASIQPGELSVVGQTSPAHAFFHAESRRFGSLTIRPNTEFRVTGNAALTYDVLDSCDPTCDSLQTVFGVAIFRTLPSSDTEFPVAFFSNHTSDTAAAFTKAEPFDLSFSTGAEAWSGNISTYVFTSLTVPSPVPAPATLWQAILGLALLGTLRRPRFTRAPCKPRSPRVWRERARCPGRSREADR